MPTPIFSHGHDLSGVSLNALRAFEAAARHLSFTRAGVELAVTQAAVSHQVKALEARLGTPLFRRTSRGLILTDEGAMLLPALSDAFAGIAARLARFERGRAPEQVTISVIGTFFVGWLVGRLPAFAADHPWIDLRLATNNNRVDLAGDSLDYAIRYGDGDWPGVAATPVLAAPLTPLCAPAIAARLAIPADLSRETLLRSYRMADWPMWLAAAGAEAVTAGGPLCDSSWIMVQAAIRGAGIALAPAAMFRAEITAGRLVRPFATEVDAGRYWLTRLKSRPVSSAMQAFATWLTTPATR